MSKDDLTLPTKIPGAAVSAVKWVLPLVVSVIVSVASAAYTVGTLATQSENRFKQIEATNMIQTDQLAKVVEQIERLKTERQDLSTRLTVIETDLKWIRSTMEKHNP